MMNAPYISLATFRKDGRKVATPIWAAPFAYSGPLSESENSNTLVMFSDPEAGKVKRLRNSSRAEVARCDVRGKLLGEWQEAQAYLLDPAEHQAIEKAAAAMREKYGWQSAALDFVSRLGGRLQKRQYIRIELTAL